MKFSDYPTLAKQSGFKSEALLAIAMENAKSKDKQGCFRAAAEAKWASNRRPYYSVYPGIVDSLLKIKLDIPLDSLEWPIENDVPILVRLEHGRSGVRAVLCGISGRGWYAICYGEHNGSEIVYLGVIGKNTKTVEDDLQGVDLGDVDEMAKDSFRLAMGICLLGNDSEFIQPEVLTADQVKFGISKDARLIEKAAKRGKRGWSVGKDLDVSPHIRRPHFAIRWTGKGGSIARVVSVKGSIVRRKIISDVPTGYLDDEKT